MMKIIYVLVLVTVFLSFGNNLEVYAQTQDSKTQKLVGIDNLLTAEEQEIFKKADKVEIFLIDERTDESVDFKKEENQKLYEKDRFHGYKVLKTVVLSELGNKQKIIENIFPFVGKGSQARCFMPRHGIRATYKDKTIEFLICFECGYIYAFSGKGYTVESISDNGESNLNWLVHYAKE
jgi:hypothetical protein